MNKNSISYSFINFMIVLCLVSAWQNNRRIDLYHNTWTLLEINETDCHCNELGCPIVKFSGSQKKCYVEKLIENRQVKPGYTLQPENINYCCDYDSGFNCDDLVKHRGYAAKCQEKNNCTAACEVDVNYNTHKYSFSCKEGFEQHFVKHQDALCVDINECSTEAKHCNQECHNTLGSYYCTCQKGYTLVDKNTCIDDNPCSFENGGCEHICENDNGNIKCLCNEGFIRNGHSQCIRKDVCTHSNGLRINDNNNIAVCEDIDECSFDNGQCSHICSNMIGSFVCLCPLQFILHDGKTCINSTFDGYHEKLSAKGINLLTGVSVGFVFLFLIIIFLIVSYLICLKRKQKRQDPQSNTEDVHHLLEMSDRRETNLYQISEGCASLNSEGGAAATNDCNIYADLNDVETNHKNKIIDEATYENIRMKGCSDS